VKNDVAFIDSRQGIRATAGAEAGKEEETDDQPGTGKPMEQAKAVCFIHVAEVAQSVLRMFRTY